MHRVDVVIASAPDPVEAQPDETWTHTQLDAFAADRGIDLGGARTKADKLAALAAP